MVCGRGIFTVHDRESSRPQYLEQLVTADHLTAIAVHAGALQPDPWIGVFKRLQGANGVRPLRML
jgi:hypothetical protein